MSQLDTVRDCSVKPSMGEYSTSILIIDDDPDIRRLLGFTLRHHGYVVQEAEDGEAALQLLEETTVDLVVSDVMMPRMDGLDLCRRIRAHPALSNLYIIMVSARGQSSDRIEGLNQGADDYISKPFEPSEVVARIRAGERQIAVQKELLAKNEELELLASTDELTGLGNRRRFDEVLHQELERASRYESSLSLALADIDHLSRINDQFGYEAGDRVLTSIASLLRNHTNGRHTVCRYGGEKFALILPKQDEFSARALAEEVRQSLEQTEIDIGPCRHAVTVSLGVSTLRQQEQSPCERLFASADRALHTAKQMGRNRVVFE